MRCRRRGELVVIVDFARDFNDTEFSSGSIPRLNQFGHRAAHNWHVARDDPVTIRAQPALIAMPARGGDAGGDGIVDAVAVTYGREPTKSFVVRGTRFEVADKYTLIKAVGKGAYGVVCSCRDIRTGRKVAVKKVEDAIVDATDAKRTLREIKLLRFLNHENIIALVDIQPPASYENFTDVYEITELMDTDLHQ